MSVDVTRLQAQIAAERRFRATAPHERPGSDSLENLLNEPQDAAIVHEILAHHAALRPADGAVLDVGAGQGWASCLVKRLRPATHVMLTDVAEEAIAGRGIWERVFARRLDAAVAAPAWALTVADASQAIVFCFAAAHHFIDHAAALREAARVLRPGGVALWLYEPVAPAWLRGAAEARVNRERPDVPEHVLVVREVLAAAHAAGLRGSHEYWPSIVHRGPVETFCYAALRAMPPLRRLLPCTSNFVFRAPA